MLSFSIPAQVRLKGQVSEYDQEILDFYSEYYRIGFHDEELQEMWEEEGPVGRKKMKERKLQESQAPCLFVTCVD